MSIEKSRKYLLEAFAAYVSEQVTAGAGAPSQAEFARYLGIPPASFSQWVLGLRPIPDHWQHVLAGVLGVGIYEACGTPIPGGDKIAELDAIIKDLRAQVNRYENIMAHFAAALDVRPDRLVEDGLPRIDELKRKGENGAGITADHV